MYATLHHPLTTPDPDPLRPLRARPALIAAYCLDAVPAGGRTIFALWQDAESAAGSAGVFGAGAADAAPFTALEIDNSWPFQSADSEPGAAGLLWFSGPISPAGRSAAQFAAQHRVLPALTGRCPGLVHGWALWDSAQRSGIVVTLATSLEAMAGTRAVVSATSLLPGEDPALLPGPDRGEVYLVTAALRAASAETTEVKS
jgi:hypothetical protein